MTPRERFARAGRKGNIVRAARADLRAQHLVMLLEQGLDLERARRRVGVAARTARRYIEWWGRN
jgi:hypothetical protein